MHVHNFVCPFSFSAQYFKCIFRFIEWPSARVDEGMKISAITEDHEYDKYHNIFYKIHNSFELLLYIYIRSRVLFFFLPQKNIDLISLIIMKPCDWGQMITYTKSKSFHILFGEKQNPLFLVQNLLLISRRADPEHHNFSHLAEKMQKDKKTNFSNILTYPTLNRFLISIMFLSSFNPCLWIKYEITSHFLCKMILCTFFFDCIIAALRAEGLRG